MDSRFATDFDSDDTDALSAYWDAVARGIPNPPTAGLDPDTLALIWRVRSASHTEVPARGRDRALAAAMHELAGHRVRHNGHERRSDVSTTTMIPLLPAVRPANGRRDPRRRQPASRSIPGGMRHWLGSAVSLAAVAVLLLALSGNLGGIRNRFPGSDDGRLNSIPAAQVPPEATPAAGIPLRTLVIPAAYLPAGKMSYGTGDYTQAPGTTEIFGSMPWAVSIEIVLTGSYGTTSDGPRLIWRGGTNAPPEEIAAGAEGIVGPGDSIAYLDGATQRARVIGDEQVLAFGIAFFGEPGNNGAIGATGDAIVELRQVTLEPGATLSAPGDVPVDRYIEAGVMTFEVIHAGESTPEAGMTFSAGVPYSPLPPGTTVVLRNDGDEPLVFLEAVVTLPAEAGTPEAATPAT